MILCQISGGIDSAAAMLELAAQPPIVGHFVDYGQRYAPQEERAAHYLARHVGFELRVSRLDLALRDTSARPDAYIPSRNFVLLALSANLASALAADAVAVGSKTTIMRPDDPYCFPDCTTAFYDAAAKAMSEGGGPHRLLRPVAGWTKARAIQRLKDASVNLAQLWWCYLNGEEPCGQCHHCRDVASAIKELAAA